MICFRLIEKAGRVSPKLITCFFYAKFKGFYLEYSFLYIYLLNKNN